jgi:hypothetical protein
MEANSMTELPVPGDTEQQTAYFKLVDALLSGSYERIAACVGDSFTAVVPGRGKLNLEQFTAYMHNLLAASPDFGRDVTVLNAVEKPGTLAVIYSSNFTVDGRAVTQVSSDWVTFEDGKISLLRVIFNLDDAQTQVFGTPLPRL